jgi:intracellular septation protein A
MIFISVQKNIIFEFSIKNWVDRCVFQMISVTLVFLIFLALLPLRDALKNDFDENHYFIVQKFPFLYRNDILKV